MRALIVGYGSIGSRHARILERLGCRVAVVTSHGAAPCPSYLTLPEALLAEEPEYVVVANRTADHGGALAELARSGFEGRVLVEKPLFSADAPLPENRFAAAYVGYNLRFHPVVRRLAALLTEERLISVQAYVGQYLPSWRPDADYRRSYSAEAAQGGGVLRDLSHELDYLMWLLGGWTGVFAQGGHYSDLEITSDDAWCLSLGVPRCPLVTVQLNYLDRVGRRFVLANGNTRTVLADVYGGTVTVDDRVERHPADRDATYIAQHRAVLFGEGADALCRLAQGREVVRLVEAAEESNQQRKWIANG